MIKAVVYKSNTGFTEKYAMMLSEEISIPVVSIDKAKIILQSNDEIIYLGWIFAGMIQGYKKACKKYQVKAVCAVGMSEDTKKYVEDLHKVNGIKEKPLFYLQGGVDKAKQKGFYKFVFNMVTNMLLKNMNKKNEEEIEDDEIKAVYNMQHGCDFVSLENLKPVIDWYNNLKLKTDL